MALLRAAVRATSASQYCGPLDLKGPQRLKGFFSGGAARLERSFGTPQSFGPNGPNDVKGVKGLCSGAAPARLDLSGVFPPIPTPFNADESLALDRLAGNMQVWERLPFRGYVVQGSNGEYPLMAPDERVELVARVRQLAAPGKLVIGGPSCESTAATVELSRAMAAAGADALMVINPSYFKSSMTEETLYAHYERVADLSPVPVVLYNMPANTGIDLPASLLTRLARHPNVAGVKDSGGDVTKMARVVVETRGLGFQVLAGSTGFLLPALLVGCVGGVNGLANILGAEVCQLYQLASEGRFAEALELHQRLLIPNALVTRELGVPAMKAAMDAAAGQGLYGGPCRRPLLPLSPQQRRRVLDAFRTHGFPLEATTDH